LNEETQHHNASLLRTAKPKTKINSGSYLEPQKTISSCNIQAAEHMVHATVHVTKKKKNVTREQCAWVLSISCDPQKQKIHQYKIMSAENANNAKSENKAHNKANDNTSTLSKIKKNIRKKKKHREVDCYEVM